MAKNIVTIVGRASYPHLTKPNKFGKYAVTTLLAKSDPKTVAKVKEIWDEIVATVKQKTQVQEEVNAILRRCQALRDGDKKELFVDRDTGKSTWRAEYAGHYIINASRKEHFGRPGIVNYPARQPIDPSEVYAGCDIVVCISVYGVNYAGKYYVNIGLQHVMKVRENTPFAGGGVTADQAFADMDIPEEVGTPGPESVMAPTTPKAPVSTTYDPFSVV